MHVRRSSSCTGGHWEWLQQLLVAAIKGSSSLEAIEGAGMSEAKSSFSPAQLVGELLESTLPLYSS